MPNVATAVQTALDEIGVLVALEVSKEGDKAAKMIDTSR
jgi:hypothetical protein